VCVEGGEVEPAVAAQRALGREGGAGKVEEEEHGDGGSSDG